MMRQMREKTKWIMLVTAAAFVGLMVFEWGMDLSGQSSIQLRGGEVGRVNGESVLYTEDFMPVYQALYDQVQRGQTEVITRSQERELEQLAWDQIVNEKLIQQEMRRRKLTATEAEVRQAARFIPPAEFTQNELFQTDGQFDLAKYHQYLASPAVDPNLLVQLEAYYRDAIPRSKLAQQVMSGMYVSDGELWRAWRDMNERASARFVRIDPEMLVPDSEVTVDDAEIAAHYNANRSDFERGARASVRLVALRRLPSAADSTATRERALRIRQEILDGADFAEVARRESEDPGSAAQGGSLGTVRRGEMVAPFDEAVFSLPVGQISEPVETQFGYHIVQVESREGDEATARHILVRLQPSDETLDALYIRADSLDRIGSREGFDAAAQRLGLTINTADLLEDLPYLEPVGLVDEGIDWAIHEAQPGDVSPVFESQTAFYMLELVELTPRGIAPLEEVAPTIRVRLRRQKKLERAREAAEAVVADVRAGRTLAEAAEARGFQVEEATSFTRLDYVPGLGRANAAVGAAFGLRPGQTSGVVEADGALFIVESLGREEADREEWSQQKALQRAQLTASFEQDRWRQFVQALREQAEIVDRREEVLRPDPEEATGLPRPRALF